MPPLETMLFLTARAATGKKIVDHDRAAAIAAVDDIERRLFTFPRADRVSLGNSMVDVRRVLRIGQNLIYATLVTGPR